MFIQTEQTPNPATLKFIPGLLVMKTGTAQFQSAEEAVKAPLASRLFGIGGIEQVFYGYDFVSVTKSEEQDWDMLKSVVLAEIMDHYTAGLPVLDGDYDVATVKASDDSELVVQIKELLDTRIKPAVAQDGGNIEFVSFDEASGVVSVQMEGACSGCPSSTATLKMGIENLLKHYVPEVTEVVPV